MQKYMIGKCPVCGAINAAAVWTDGFTDDAEWRDTREEFEECGLVVSEISEPAPALAGCDCKERKDAESQWTEWKRHNPNVNGSTVNYHLIKQAYIDGCAGR